MGDSVIHAIAGATGGVVAMSATYPLVFLSTLAAVETKRKSTYQAVVDVTRREGISGLYNGLKSSLLGIAVTNGVYYYFYEHSREIILRIRSGGKALSPLESMLIGLIGGSATTVISNPIWVVQTVQTLSVSSGEIDQLGFFDTVRSIITKGGPGALWRGIGPALVLVVNPIIQYTVFEQLKNFLVKTRTAKLRALADARAPRATVLSDWDFFLLGAVSKLAATGLTYPYIVVKSRLQAGTENSSKYRSSLDGIFTILRDEGIEGLYRGIGNKLLQSVLTAAILFAVQRRIFELTKNFIERLSRHRNGMSRAVINLIQQ